MAEILRFPKDKVQYINIIYDLYYSKKYLDVSKYKERLLQNFDILKDTFVFDYLVISLFELGSYQEVVDTYYELFRYQYETFGIMYLTIASLIALDDVYQANYLVKKSVILKDSSFTNFLSSEGANFYNLTSLDNEAFGDVIITIILINYIQAIAKESLIREINQEYLFYRFFDLINIILEVGFSEKIVNDLTEIGQKIFILK